jgi:acetoin utilization protein AcuB
MLIRDWMTKDVVTVCAHDTMQQAIDLMQDYDIRMLPVMDGGILVGIVTDRDIKRASPSDTAMLDSRQIKYHLARVQIGAIMSRNPVAVPDDYTIEETAEVLLNNKFSGCPVVDREGKIVGIVSKDDLFGAMISMNGLPKRGVQFGFLLEDRPGSIREVTDIIRGEGGRLVSIMSTYHDAPPGHRFAYVRAFNLDRLIMQELKAKLSEKAKILYMVDHRENRREIYST